MRTANLLTIAVLAVLLAIVSFVACNEHRQRIEAAKTKEEITTTLPTAPVVRTYKDSNGQLHAVVRNEIPTKEVIEKLVPFIDSVSNALDVKPKQIESITSIATETQAKEIAFLQKKVDSLMKQTFYYKDKYLELAVRSGNPADTADKGTFDFKYNADLTINQYWKRRRFLGIGMGAKVSYTDISSNDPRTTIMGVKKYTVKQQQPGWGLRIQATQNYSFINNSANTGIGARFDLKHLSLYGAYYYNWQLRDWRPVMSMSYDIIRF